MQDKKLKCKASAKENIQSNFNGQQFFVLGQSRNEYENQKEYAPDYPRSVGACRSIKPTAAPVYTV